MLKCSGSASSLSLSVLFLSARSEYTPGSVSPMDRRLYSPIAFRTSRAGPNPCSADLRYHITASV